METFCERGREGERETDRETISSQRGRSGSRDAEMRCPNLDENQVGWDLGGGGRERSEISKESRTRQVSLHQKKNGSSPSQSFQLRIQRRQVYTSRQRP